MTPALSVDCPWRRCTAEGWESRPGGTFWIALVVRNETPNRRAPEPSRSGLSHVFLDKVVELVIRGEVRFDSEYGSSHCDASLSRRPEHSGYVNASWQLAGAR